jgi:N-acetylneuraminic acid mutarotase
VKVQESLAILALLLAACQDATEPGGSAPPQPSLAAVKRPPPELIPGQYLVVFKDQVQDPASVAQKLVARHRGKLRHTYKVALKGMAIELSDTAIDALRREPDVAYVEQNQVVRLEATTTQPNAIYGIDRIDQRSLPLSGSYSYAADGSGVTVYILDTGIYYGHTDFGGRAVFGQDLLGRDGANGGVDCNGHGTHVSGIVGGTVYGVAKKVKLVSVRVLNCQGVGQTFYIISAIEWITANKTLPAVANLSLTDGFSPGINDAIARSTAAGVTYVAAAGNFSDDACQHSPASAPEAITVAASDSLDEFAGFSAWGSCVDLEAPGVLIRSDYIGSSTANVLLTGTSMAAPHVAGAVALYLSTTPTATPAQVTDAILGNSTVNPLHSVPAGTYNRLLYTGFLLPPSTSSWIARASLLTARSGFAVGKVNDLLYAMGGRSNASTLRTVEQYDPTLDRWTSKAPMPAARAEGSGTGAINGLLYFAGGKNGAGTLTRTLFAYNAASNSWSTKAPLPTPSGCGGAGVIGGQLYVLTGCTTTTGFKGLLHRYNPSTNSWTARATAPSPHGYPAVGVISGKLYVAGGKNAAGQATTALHVYTPGTNSWATKAPMPSARYGAAAKVINGKWYLIGGTGASGTLGSTLVYDPVANSWSVLDPMPTARSQLAAEAVGGLLYGIGGRGASGDLKLVERLTP